MCCEVFEVTLDLWNLTLSPGSLYWGGGGEGGRGGGRRGGERGEEGRGRGGEGGGGEGEGREGRGRGGGRGGEGEEGRGVDSFTRINSMANVYLLLPGSHFHAFFR